MKVTSSLVRKILIEDAPGLVDPIEIVLEDLGPKKGSIFLRSHSQTYSAYWNAMPKDTVAEFVATCSPDYMINCMTHCMSQVEDHDAMRNLSKAKVLELRKADDLTAHQARELYEEIKDMENPHHHQNAMYEVFGDQWWNDMPYKANPTYIHLEKVVNAVKDAVKTLIRQPSCETASQEYLDESDRHF